MRRCCLWRTPSCLWQVRYELKNIVWDIKVKNCKNVQVTNRPESKLTRKFGDFYQNHQSGQFLSQSYIMQSGWILSFMYFQIFRYCCKNSLSRRFLTCTNTINYVKIWICVTWKLTKVGHCRPLLPGNKWILPKFLYTIASVCTITLWDFFCP